MTTELQEFRLGQRSESISELAAALANVQASMRGAKKDSQNPYFKSSYADLESVIAASQPHVSDNGLSVTQTMGYLIYGETLTSTLITTLLHSSGEWISGEMPLFLLKADPQGQGSAISYARRYGYASILSIYQTDDDAERSMNPPAQEVDKGTGEVTKAPKEILKEIETNVAREKMPYDDLWKVAEKVGFTKQQIKVIMKSKCGVEAPVDLDEDMAAKLIKLVVDGVLKP